MHTTPPPPKPMVQQTLCDSVRQTASSSSEGFRSANHAEGCERLGELLGSCLHYFREGIAGTRDDFKDYCGMQSPVLLVLSICAGILGE